MKHRLASKIVPLLLSLLLVFNITGIAPVQANTITVISATFDSLDTLNTYWKPLLGTAAINPGWLQLTSATTSQVGAAVYNMPLSTQNSFDIQFDYATYGGTGGTGGSGGDGIAFYMIDGSEAPDVGGTGGNLGYVGVKKGYFGIGLSEYSAQIKLWGSGDQTSGFAPLTSIAASNIGTGNRAGYKHVHIAFHNNHVWVWLGESLMIDNYDLSIAVGQAPLPETLKFGISGATGGATNIHEIDNLVVTVYTPTILRVTSGGTTSESCGASWANACALQTALANSRIGDEIWVAASTYKPGTLPTDTFQLRNGVAVYGGFVGTETARAERNPAANLTILSGDLNGDDNGNIQNNEATRADNSYHVVVGANNATLDGFTITGGNANGAGTTDPDNKGGGMYNEGVSPVLNNLIFDKNTARSWGGGMANFNSANPTVTNTTFSQNVTGYEGGGVDNHSSSPTLTNVTFSQNSAGNLGGGIANINNSLAQVNHVTFHNNTGFNGGHGIYNYGSSATISNVILWKSTSLTGTQIHNLNGSVPAVSDSVVEGGYAGGTNIITKDPKLGTLGNNGGFTTTIALLAGSSAINKGSSCSLGKDQRGVSYIGTCDIGAYEYDYTGVHYAKPSASGAGNCQSWANACTLEAALVSVSSGDEIWVAKGVHKPGTLRADTFQLVAGVGVYGGFTSTETAREERNPAANLTTLSGDLNGNDNSNIKHDDATRADNVYHVVIGANNATLDGFTITGGNAYNSSVPADTSTDNRGGGMYNEGASPTLNNLIFDRNTTRNWGGGMANFNSANPIVTNTTFSQNVSAYEGGGMDNHNGSGPSLTNVTFSENSAGSLGGGISNISTTVCNAQLNHVTFTNNSVTAGTSGGGIYNYHCGTTVIIRNTILWGNTASFNKEIYNLSNSTPLVSDSVIEGGYTGGTNIITTDPKLGTLGKNGGFTTTIPILAGSSAINNGAACPTDGTDQRGVSYVKTCDIGAYEYTGYMGIFHAKPTASGTEDCQSWENACTLSTALNLAASGDDVWAAGGTYTPGSLRTDTFQLKYGVGVYGGFAGTEMLRARRSSALNATILSGDLLGDDVGFTNNGENSYHVVTGTTGATLDGFTITKGNANGTTVPNNQGGGMYNSYSSPTLANLVFTGNMTVSGGGMYNSYSNPAITNVTFANNTATWEGGGIFNSYSNPRLTNVTFSGNTAGHGGGMINLGSAAVLMNATFHNNSATLSDNGKGGGGLYNYYSPDTKVYSAILWGNTAVNGPQINNIGGNILVSNSVVQGGYAGGTKIITADPKLGTLGDYGGVTPTVPLLAGSSAINATSYNCLATDQRGATRSTPTCDIGAFEVHAPTAITAAATAITSTTATLNGTVNANEFDSTITFEYGLTTSYGSTIAASESPVTGNLTTPVSGNLTGLTANTTYHYRVVAINHDGSASGADMTFTTNATPTNITLLPASIAENKPIGSVVGTLTATDPNPTDSFSFSLVSGVTGCNSANNTSFQITANQLKTKAIFDYETKKTYNICVRADDGKGGIFNKAFVVNVTNVMDEIVKNGDFEAYTGASKIPTSWMQTNFGTTDGKNTTKYHGLYSINITGATGKTKTLTQTLTIGGTSGNAFTFSFWVKGAAIPTTAGLCQGQVILYNGSTTVTTKTLPCSTGTYGFQKKSLTFNATGAYTKVVILFTYSKTTGSIFFDLASLLK